jgi:4-diphosphocytidyl-2-C-methyl-D-erythritol kinase
MSVMPEIRPLAPLLRDCLAPAKLNLFLHITGRRADGYHLLQTVFQMVDWGDRLHFTRNDDGAIRRANVVLGVEESSDLTIRAAKLMQSYTGCGFGVEIAVEKILPMGAGLGGGSSDAATTLLALNSLWDLHLPRSELQTLALRLGADVPFFVFGQNAFAEGVGEELQAVRTPSAYFLIVTPPVHVSTIEVFTAKDLTRDSKPITITDFLGAQSHDATQAARNDFGRNDMQAVVARKYPEVAQVLRWFSENTPDAPSRMSGSGASVFAAFATEQEAVEAQRKLPDKRWKSQVAASLNQHPLYQFGR